MPDGMPKRYPTTITITQQGQILPDAGVTLVSLGNSPKWVSGSLTDKHGNATIRTHGQYDGAPLGKLE
jgi:hypothetical protein